MANNLLIDPMYIDTAGVIVTKGKPVNIRFISVQFSADDEDILLSDADGNVIWQAKAGDVSVNGYNQNVKLCYTGNNGLTCTTIDGTTVALIYS